MKSDGCSDGSLKTIKSGFDLVIGANHMQISKRQREHSSAVN